MSGYCNWKNTSLENVKYHDEEWGRPVFDDKSHFECLMLEGLQCGLSWNTILKKRDIIRVAFEDFEISKVANYSQKDVQKIMNIEGMIKSENKIKAIVNNASVFLSIINEFGSFNKYIWNFSDNKTILYENHEKGYIPASNGLSDKISRDMKKRGLKYVGPVTVYSYLQAVGIINDHDENCPIYNFINSKYPTIKLPNYLEKNVFCFK